MFSGVFLLTVLLMSPLSPVDPVSQICSCPTTLSTDQQTVDAMMHNAVMVFVGKVTAANLPGLNTPGRSFRFSVHENFKGAPKNSVVVFSALRSAECGTTVAIGKTYLVAAYGSASAPIIQSCDRPEEIDFVAPRLALLRRK